MGTETYRGERFDRLLKVVMRLLTARYLSVREHRVLLEMAGYADVAIVEEEAKGWICAVGRRPGELAAQLAPAAAVTAA